MLLQRLFNLPHALGIVTTQQQKLLFWLRLPCLFYFDNITQGNLLRIKEHKLRGQREWTVCSGDKSMFMVYEGLDGLSQNT